MSDDYLWDGSGEPDPEIERLERLLRPLRHDRPAPRFVAPRPWLGSAPATWAAAAAVALALGTAWLSAPRVPAWEVSRLSGAPQVGATRLARTARLTVGERIETDAASRVRISVGSIGEVELGPRTRARLLDAGVRHHRLALERGVLHARIWASPGRFLVDTPAATAVDLGCAYTLEVDDSGAGLLSVQSGWVAFAHEGRESFVPKGARCATRPGVGPGTPYLDDAPGPVRVALDRLDSATDAEARRVALDVLLLEARPKDALSLWHVLGRVEAAERARVYDRLVVFVPPPPGVTREGILAGDRAMLDRFWNALGYGDVSWWRLWERPWTPPLR